MGKYVAEIYADAPDAADEADAHGADTAGGGPTTVLDVHMVSGGGNAMWIHPVEYGRLITGFLHASLACRCTVGADACSAFTVRISLSDTRLRKKFAPRRAESSRRRAHLRK